jgi:hypothetical protein
MYGPKFLMEDRSFITAFYLGKLRKKMVLRMEFLSGVIPFSISAFLIWGVIAIEHVFF